MTVHAAQPEMRHHDCLSENMALTPHTSTTLHVCTRRVEWKQQKVGLCYACQLGKMPH